MRIFFSASFQDSISATQMMIELGIRQKRQMMQDPGKDICPEHYKHLKKSFGQTRNGLISVRLAFTSSKTETSKVWIL